MPSKDLPGMAPFTKEAIRRNDPKYPLYIYIYNINYIIGLQDVRLQHGGFQMSYG